MSEPSELRTQASLLVRIRDARDVPAWTAFVELYGPVVYRYSRRRGVQDADAADLLQEVLAEVARCIQEFQYQPERGRFRDWLFTVTRRRLNRFFERKKRPGAAGEPAPLDLVAAQPADAEWTSEFNGQVLRAALERARPQFEPETWRAFERAWLEHQPAVAVAAELGIPVDKVYVAKSRVLKRLEQEVRLLAEDLPRL
ncbi:MAG: sigma-70 family RNA polymerase sigma factor [Gemmataceae bacterium]